VDSLRPIPSRHLRPLLPKGYPPRSREGSLSAAAPPASAIPADPAASADHASSADPSTPVAAPSPAALAGKADVPEALAATLPAVAISPATDASRSDVSQRASSLRRSLTLSHLSPRGRSSSSMTSMAEAQSALAFVGGWKQVRVTNLDGYLKHLGVPWAKRKLAGAFKPELSFAVVDGVLQVLMPSPIGERLEKLPIGVEVIDVDPSGNEFVKTSRWDGAMLVTTAVDRAGKTADTITRRSIRTSDGMLVQTNMNASVSFERIFTRKA